MTNDYINYSKLPKKENKKLLDKCSKAIAKISKKNNTEIKLLNFKKKKPRKR